MKKLLLTIMLIAASTAMSAQENQKKQGVRFSPEKFEAELHDFIVSEAHLSAQEEVKFFPVYREMQQKQRAIYDHQRNLGKQKPQDEEGCLKVIKERDEKEIELKRIQQQYHKRFLELMPATKVWDILKAEERFHRRAMKNWGQRQGARHAKDMNPHRYKTDKAKSPQK